MNSVLRLGVAGLVAMGGIRAAAAGEIVVDDGDQTRTYDCDGGGAVVNSGDNVLTFHNCSRVVVNGADNRIDAGAAGLISVQGNGNSVTFTEVPGHARPKIVNMGEHNTISPASGGPVRKSQTDAEDLGVALGGGGVTPVRDGKGTITVAGDGTVRVEGSHGGTVELTDRGVTARAAKDIVVKDNNRTESLDCAGGSASVDGNSGVLTLRSCRKVTVSGNGNKLELVGATAISILGNGNDVGWSPGPGGETPTLSDLGKKNLVTRRP